MTTSCKTISFSHIATNNECFSSTWQCILRGCFYPSILHPIIHTFHSSFHINAITSLYNTQNKKVCLKIFFFFYNKKSTRVSCSQHLEWIYSCPYPYPCVHLWIRSFSTCKSISSKQGKEWRPKDGLIWTDRASLTWDLKE